MQPRSGFWNGPREIEEVFSVQFSEVSIRKWQMADGKWRQRSEDEDEDEDEVEAEAGEEEDFKKRDAGKVRVSLRRLLRG